MELELQYATQEEIPEGYGDLYSEKDGQWHLTGVKGLSTATAGTANLRKSLEAERKAHKETKKSLTEAQQEMTKITTERDELQIKVDSNGNIDDKKMTELVERRVAIVRGPLEQKVQAAESKAAEFESKLNEALGRERLTNANAAIRDAAAKAGITDPNALHQAVRLFGSEIQLDEATGTYVAREGGEFTPGIDLPTIFNGEAKKRYGNLWPQSVGAGARAPGSTVDGDPNPYSHEHWNLTNQMTMLSKDRPKAERMAKLVGVDIKNPKKPEPPKRS